MWEGKANCTKWMCCFCLSQCQWAGKLPVSSRSGSPCCGWKHSSISPHWSVMWEFLCFPPFWNKNGKLFLHTVKLAAGKETKKQKVQKVKWFCVGVQDIPVSGNHSGRLWEQDARLWWAIGLMQQTCLMFLWFRRERNVLKIICVKGLVLLPVL